MRCSNGPAWKAQAGEEAKVPGTSEVPGTLNSSTLKPIANLLEFLDGDLPRRQPAPGDL